MPAVSFGTAQLGDLPREVRPVDLLEAAWQAGFRRFDTAPLYARGRSESDLGRFLTGREGVEVTTTKVGLLPDPDRPVRRRVVRTAKAALPSAVLPLLKRVLRPEPGERVMHSGRFGTDEVRGSVETSLRRLGGRIDRLLLHEVRPHDVTPELLALLAGFLRRGDVGELGVATQNHDTLEVLAAGGETFTAVNIAVGPLHAPVALPAHVRTRVGHGLLGGGGEHLRRMQAVLRADAELGARWAEATRDTEFGGSRGLGNALLARGPDLDVGEVVVASTRVANVAEAHRFAARTDPLPAAVSAVLSELVAAASSGRARRT